MLSCVLSLSRVSLLLTCIYRHLISHQWTRTYQPSRLSRCAFLRSTPTPPRSATSTPTSTPPRYSRKWGNGCPKRWLDVAIPTLSPSCSPVGRPAFSKLLPHNSKFLTNAHPFFCDCNVNSIFWGIKFTIPCGHRFQCYLT